MLFNLTSIYNTLYFYIHTFLLFNIPHIHRCSLFVDGPFFFMILTKDMKLRHCFRIKSNNIKKKYSATKKTPLFSPPNVSTSLFVLFWLFRSLNYFWNIKIYIDLLWQQHPTAIQYTNSHIHTSTTKMP